MAFAARGLSFAYRKRPVFSDVTFALEAGQICCLLGPNGAGKSTLLNCLGAYLRPQQGSVELDGVTVQTMAPSQRARHIGFVTQLHDSSVDLRVHDYLVLGSAMRVGLLGTPSESEYQRAGEVMARFSIEELAERSLLELSGGERQQVEIARVLVQNPDVILMDEPTNHLDYANQIKVLSMVKRLSEGRTTVLLTSHAPDHALLLDGLVALLDNGTLELGKARDLCTQERLSALYDSDLRVVHVPDLGRKAIVTGRIP